MRVAALVLGAVAVIVLLLVFSERATPFTGVKGEADAAPMTSGAQVLESERAPVPVVVKELPGVPDGSWTYTLNAPLIPSVDDPIYNGRMSAGTWWSGSSAPNDIEGARRAIVKRIVPSLTDRDSAGLSIWRNQDNPTILLGAVDVVRDQQTQAELFNRGELSKADELSKLRQFELHLGLSLDNGETWRKIPLTFMRDPGNGRELGIDNVVVTGTSPLLVSVQPFSSHGWFQREVVP